MASKKLKVQGSRFFAFDGENIKRMQCLKTFDPGSDSTTKIDDTCLDEPDTKSSVPGLSDPGDGSLGFDIDIKNPSHLEIVEWANQKKQLTIIVGSADSDAVPTVEDGALIFPKTRTWWVFDATLTTPVWKFDQDTLVNCTITMQRKSKTDFKPETT
ncbi:phage tail tube protein [Acinetobacter rudis]|uniref:phage tail tube protein n=1 Tax=Acinetobacter rudis TaxID=632955 RepID=UPI00280FEEF5|nr:phage tail tube protein [Acinetobacter rudis]MDQ8951942.1 phage tail tube protein [Acinetobacter rudis]